MNRFSSSSAFSNSKSKSSGGEEARGPIGDVEATAIEAGEHGGISSPSTSSDSDPKLNGGVEEEADGKVVIATAQKLIEMGKVMVLKASLLKRKAE